VDKLGSNLRRRESSLHIIIVNSKIEVIYEDNSSRRVRLILTFNSGNGLNFKCTSNGHADIIQAREGKVGAMEGS